MFTFDLINIVKSEIVKFSRIETLNYFYNCHPEYGSSREGRLGRERSLPFRALLPFLIYPRAKSTDIELLEFSRLIGKPNVNKSDFSKQRRLIPADYLKSLHHDIVSDMYEQGVMAKWHGHLLLAGDGTTYSLPNTPEIKRTYLQGRRTGRGQQALARGIVIKDVLNDVIVASNMECYGKDEIRLLLDELSSVPEAVTAMSPVMLLDRKFCAYTLLAALEQHGFGFIIRVKERFNPEVDSFISSGESQRDVVLTPASTTVRKLKRLYGKEVNCQFEVRLLRLSPSVVVMTSVMEDIAELGDPTDPYHLRWDVESTIGFVKNALQVEIFSSSLVNSIRQDFHAKTIQYNLLSLLCHQAAELRHDHQPRKIDRNIALGIFKLEFMLFMPDCTLPFNKHLHRVLTQIARFTTAIKPGRHNPRLFRKIKHSGKYITLYNYREAI